MYVNFKQFFWNILCATCSPSAFAGCHEEKTQECDFRTFPCLKNKKTVALYGCHAQLQYSNSKYTETSLFDEFETI